MFKEIRVGRTHAAAAVRRAERATLRSARRTGQAGPAWVQREAMADLQGTRPRSHGHRPDARRKCPSPFGAAFSAVPMCAGAAAKPKAATTISGRNAQSRRKIKHSERGISLDLRVDGSFASYDEARDQVTRQLQQVVAGVRELQRRWDRIKSDIVGERTAVAFGPQA